MDNRSALVWFGLVYLYAMHATTTTNHLSLIRLSFSHPLLSPLLSPLPSSIYHQKPNRKPVTPCYISLTTAAINPEEPLLLLFLFPFGTIPIRNSEGKNQRPTAQRRARPRPVGRSGSIDRDLDVGVGGTRRRERKTGGRSRRGRKSAHRRQRRWATFRFVSFRFCTVKEV